MKRVIFLLFVLWTSLFSSSMSAQDSYLVVNTSVLRYNPDGATQKFTVTSNVDWTISVEGGDEWIEVTPLSGNGNKEISVSATTNTNTDPREATISISGNGLSQTIRVYQAGNGYLTTNTTNLRFNPDGRTQTFNIFSNVDWTISVEGGDGWLTVSPMSGSGNQTITVKIEESNGYSLSPHVATIIISRGKLTQTISVNQSISSYLAVSTNDIRFGFDKSTQEFTISSNVDWDISIEGGTGWLTVTPQSGRGDNEVTVSATANTNPNPREATISISGNGLNQPIKVYQEGYRYLAASTTQLSFNSGASAQRFSVVSNVSWNITVEGGDGWLTVTPTSKTVSGHDETEVKVTKYADTGDPNGGPYHAIITVAGGGLTQTVEAWAPWSHYLTVDTSHLDFNSNGGKQSFSITSNRDWNISVEGGDGWLEVIPLSGDGSKEITVSATTNTNIDPREATITVSGYWISQTIKIYQAGNGYLTVIPASLIFSEIAGAQTFNVTSNVDWNISVEGGSGWLTVTPQRGRGGQEITVTAWANTGSNPRTATITISGGGIIQTVNVTQNGCGYINVNTSTLRYNVTAGSQMFTVTSNVDWNVSVIGGGGWLTVTPSSGSGNKEITVTATANTGSSPRNATITVSNGGLTQTVNVLQNGNGYINVSTATLRYNDAAGTQKFTITSNVDWSVSVDGGTGWLTVTPQSGSGNKEVTVSATANTGSSPRTATITISNGGLTQTVNVTQYGNGYLTASTTELKYNPTTSEQKFNVSSNVSWNITMEGGNGWLMVTPISKKVLGNDVTEVTVEVTDNTGSISPRSATITISGNGLTQIVKVYQSGIGYINVNTNQINLAANQTLSFNIMSNIDWSIIIEDGAGWLGVNPMNGYGDQEITLERINQHYMGPGYATLIIYGYGITQTIHVTLWGLDNIDDTLMEEGKKNLNTIYDLSGRRTTCSSKDLGKLRQGVYIINGKKYLIK